VSPLVEGSHLTKVFPLGRGHVNAVNDVSISIERAEVVGCVGESGSGKTTLARLMMGLESPTSGTLAINGTEVSARTGRAPFQQIQMLFQDPGGSLPPRMRVGDVLEDPLIVRGIRDKRERRERVVEIITRVGLPSSVLSRVARQLSGGQRHRVSLARVLIVEPGLLIADEPASALDVSVRSQIVNLMAELHEKDGIALYIISHDLRIIYYLTDRVIVLYLGRVVERGLTKDVVHAPAHPYTRCLVSAVPGKGVSRDRVAIGEVDSLVSVGCPFAPRCPLRKSLAARQQQICDERVPELVHVGGSREAACHWL
jgi:oligopeptide/dipeptide ABC transporter ATP-binding protein